MQFFFFFQEISESLWNSVGADIQKSTFYMRYIHTYKAYVCSPFWKGWRVILRKSLTNWENFQNILQGMFELFAYIQFRKVWELWIENELF